MIGSFGGAAAADGYDFEATKWESLFEGEYSVAKMVMKGLEAASIPNRLTFPDGHSPPSVVVVQVMKKWQRKAREAMAIALAEPRGRPEQAVSGRLTSQTELS